MNKPITKIAARILLIMGVFALAVSAASLRTTTPGLTFATYGIDLKIDSEATYNGAPIPGGTWNLKNLAPGVDKFFNFDDIKPGDHGENTISMHVKKADAWLCLDFKNLTQAENGVNEPETTVDGAGDGELAEVMEFFSWVDDGDNLFELGERPLFGTTTQSATEVLNNTSYPIGDAGSGGACRVNQVRYAGIFWCAGNLTVDLNTASINCDGSNLGNGIQTDTMSVDVSIRALPANEHKGFSCAKGSVNPPPIPSGTGSVGGTVYEDKNGNSKKGPNEIVLSGWTINLYDGAGWWGKWGESPIKSVMSDSNGNYIFSGLADGVYSVEQIIKTGWNQVTSDYRSITVKNGQVITGKDFGNEPKKNKKW